MRPFDPRLLRAAPAARPALVTLGAVGVLQGVATVGSAVALAGLVVAVVDRSPIVVAAWWLVALLGVRGGLAWVGERAAARAGVQVSTALRERLVADWLRGTAEERPDSDHATTLAAQGCSAVEPYAARFLPALVAASVVPLLAVGALVVVDWLSALVVVLTLPLLPIFAALIGRTTQEQTRRRWRALAALAGHFHDVVRGLPTLVGFGRAERQVDTIGAVSERHRRATMSTLRLAFLSSAALELLATISVAIVAVGVGLRLTNGSISLHAGLLAILLAPEAYWPIRRMGAEFHAAADGAEALAEILPLLSDPAAGARAAVSRDHDPWTVETVGLGYRFHGSTREVLTDVDLVAGPGLTVITGPSGAGKTTLLEVLAGLRTPTAGRVRAPVAHLVTQRAFLPAGTVRDNLSLGNDAGDDRLWRALRDVALDGLVASLPGALDSRIGDDGFGLSAGQRARLAVARATLTSASLILVDEPTAHLDPVSCDVVHGVLRTLAQDHVVVVVSHRPELVALADAHVHLAPAVAGHDGPVVGAAGSPGGGLTVVTDGRADRVATAPDARP